MTLEGNFMAVESDSKLPHGLGCRCGMTRPRKTVGDMKKTQSTFIDAL